MSSSPFSGKTVRTPHPAHSPPQTNANNNHATQIAITGAASGMGLATAQLLASRGARISLADINGPALRTALDSLARDQHPDQRHLSTVVDVRDRASVDAWIAATVRELGGGRLDGAVNMAGVIAKAVPVAEAGDEEWEQAFAVNAKGVFNCVRAQLGAMVGAGKGSIVSALCSDG